ncbi:hypothetical protein D3C86_2209260 [compost metagenome]
MEGAQDDDSRMLVQPGYRSRQFQTCHAGHTDIGDEQVDFIVFQQLQRFRSACRLQRRGKSESGPVHMSG